ncbi:AGE family epimerase/isomerase [Angustibacter peucedani]
MTPSAVGVWASHADGLAALVPRALHPAGGFGWLDDENRVTADRGVATWITCRMTHVAALATLRTGGRDPDLERCLDQGAAALGRGGLLRDDRHGGWFSQVGPDGAVADDGTKAAYAHAFVVLAASSLTAAGHPSGPALLADALATFDTHFWDDAEGMARESWDRAWTTTEDYRGVNANMHAVECMLAAGRVLDDHALVDRAERVVDRVVGTFAREAGWRLPEHFTATWDPLPDFNRDRPADPFRPYGVTIGHVLEWARLALDLRTALRATRPRPDLLEDAVAMFDAAVRRGWSVDGAPGFVYTTDLADRPVVRQRLHWVLCEAFATAATLDQETSDPRYAQWLTTLWDFAEQHLIDHRRGGWVHELSPQNEPASEIWWGKPDVYHAYQAALVPSYPGLVAFSDALRRPSPQAVPRRRNAP